MGGRQALHLDLRQSEFCIFFLTCVIIKVSASESVCYCIALAPHCSYFKHDPVIIKTSKLVINSMNTINDLSPFKKASRGSPILIPQISAVKLVFQTEEIQPFRAGQD